MISIVVPMHNASEYIEETIRCVQGQTFTDWELILVDDASTDNTIEIAGKAAGKDARIHILERKENGGAARARNDGVDAARGECLAFLDADDIWKGEKLEHEFSFLKEKGAAFVCHSYEFGDEKAHGTGKVVHVPETLTYKKALTRTVVFTSTVMFDLEKLSKEDLYMVSCGSEDTALWWRLMRNNITCYGLDENLAIYRRPPVSLSSNKGKAIVRIWKLYREQEHLGMAASLFCIIGWAARATLRRI